MKGDIMGVKGRGVVQVAARARKVRSTFTLSPDVAGWVFVCADRKGVSRSEFVEDLLLRQYKNAQFNLLKEMYQVRAKEKELSGITRAAKELQCKVISDEED